MEEDKKLKKKKLTIIFSILFMVIILLGSTYAFFTYSKSTSAFTLTSNRIKAEFIEGTNSINITNAYPISDEFALANLDKLSYLDFTVSSEISNEDQAVTYEIYLTEDTNNTLDSNYIKVYLTDDSNNKITGPTIYNSLDYTNYSKDSTTGKLIYKGNNPGTKSKNFRLYAWIDKDYEQNSVSQVFKFNVNIYAYNDTNKELASVFNNSLQKHTTESCPTNIVEDNITYISGSQDCINFNYVWYSGKLWRITAIYPDGTMKMITDDNITTISYGSNVNFYTDNENKSYMYQWLNEDFLDTLYNYENIIVTDSKWNSLATEDETTKITEGASGVTTTTSPVGLLNSYEHYMSYKDTIPLNGYLNIAYDWWLLNPYRTSYVWYVSNNGSSYGITNSPVNTLSVRPSINLKSEIQLFGGSGTKNDPYTIAGDKEEITPGTTLLNTRSSGEYVKFNNELYRIVSIENNITKINKNDYVRDTSDNVLTKKFSTSVTYGGGTTDDYWDYYLNNTWYNSLDTSYQDMIVESTYYIGTVSGSYKASICATASNTITTKDCEKTTNTWTGLVGLPRYGEMFASQRSGYSSSSAMWLMNPYSTSYVWDLHYFHGYGQTDSPTNAYGGRPFVNLKSNIKITGGKGTKDNPFEISE